MELIVNEGYPDHSVRDKSRASFDIAVHVDPDSVVRVQDYPIERRSVVTFYAASGEATLFVRAAELATLGALLTAAAERVNRDG